MIYCIYCFSYFIKDENFVKKADEITLEKIDKKNLKPRNNSKIETASLERVKTSLKEKNKSSVSKPIVSSSPKPIKIDSNLVVNKNINTNISKANNLVIEKSSETKVDKKLISTLKLNEVMICRGIYKRNPIKPGTAFINDVDSLFCYTKISNSGKKQEVQHIWYFEDKEMTTVSYNIKPSYNYRSWSKKTIYPNQTGKWRVDVVNRDGDILGTREFIINSTNSTY